MAASQPGMRAVELVEDDGAASAAVPDGPDVGRTRTRAGTGPGRGPDGGRDGGPTPRSGPWSGPVKSPRPRRRLLSATAVAVALGAVVGDATADARHRAGAVAVSRVPGVVASLDRPLVELWRADPTLRPDLGEAGGRLVGTMGERGGADVVGLDPATGAVVWRTAVRAKGPGGVAGGVRCVVPDPPTAGAGTPQAVRPGTGPYAVCVVDRAAPPPPGRSPRRAPQDRLLTLDVRDGTVVADRTVSLSTVLSALGPDVVTAYVDTAGHVHVARTDPLGDQVRWTFVTPRPLPPARLAWGIRVEVQDGVVVVDDAEGWVLSGDGAVLHSWATAVWSAPEGASQVVGAGRYLVRPQAQGGTTPRTRVTDLRTGRTFGVLGHPLATRPDDGSHDHGVLVRAGRPGALAAAWDADVASWQAPGGVHGTPMVVDGRVIRIGSADLASIDARTGRVLWSTPLRRTPRSSLLTDGRLAVVTRLDPEDDVVLTAYGLDDGRPRWTVDLADDITALTVSGRRVFGWTGRQVVALGPAG